MSAAPLINSLVPALLSNDFRLLDPNIIGLLLQLFLNHLASDILDILMGGSVGRFLGSSLRASPVKGGVGLEVRRIVAILNQASP